MGPVPDGENYGTRSGGKSLADLVYQHDKDLYIGNGKPGLTTRMHESEKCSERIERDNVVRDERIKTIDKKFNVIIMLLITVLAGLVTSMVMESRSQSSQHTMSTMY